MSISETTIRLRELRRIFEKSGISGRAITDDELRSLADASAKLYETTDPAKLGCMIVLDPEFVQHCLQVQLGMLHERAKAMMQAREIE